MTLVESPAAVAIWIMSASSMAAQTLQFATSPVLRMYSMKAVPHTYSAPGTT